MNSSKRIIPSVICFALAFVLFLTIGAMFPHIGMTPRNLWLVLDALIAAMMGMIGGGIGALFGHPFLGFFGTFMVIMAGLFFMHATGC